MSELLQIDFRPLRAAWILQLKTRLHASCSDRIQRFLLEWKASGIAEIVLAVTTRWMILDEVTERINSDLRELAGVLPTGQGLRDHVAGGYVFTLPNPRLSYRLCADVDAFYFETHSLYELTWQFVARLCRRALNRPVDRKELVRILENRGAPAEWVEELRVDRNFFSHEGAPWIAVEVTDYEAPSFELVILKRNIEDLEDERHFVRLSAMRSILQGHSRAMDHLFDWLTNEVSAAEARDCKSAV